VTSLGKAPCVRRPKDLKRTVSDDPEVKAVLKYESLCFKGVYVVPVSG